MKTYDIDLFYELSIFFNDDLRLMAHAVAYALNLDAKVIYKDFNIRTLQRGIFKSLARSKGQPAKSLFKPTDKI